MAGVDVGSGGTALWLELLRRAGGATAMALVPLVVVVFLIWESRKVIGRMQDRLGPTNAGTYAGPFALFQTVADAIKILTKELIIPQGADRTVFVIAPVMIIAVAIAVWAVIPLGPRGLQVVDLDVGAFYVVAVSSLAPFSMIMAGWSSRNKYAEVGAFRAVSQIIGYEVPQILALLVPVLLTGSLSLQDIVRAQDVPYVIAVPLAALVFFLASAAEVGRLPFELAEADSEIVAGYFTEYSGMMFGAFYLAEFINTFTTSMLFSILFLGGWRGPWVNQIPLLGAVWILLKAFLVFNVLNLFWAAMPRLRIDQVLGFNWKFLVPLGLVILMVVAVVDKLLANVGVPVGWGRSAGLLLANLLMGSGVVAFLFWYQGHLSRREQRRQANALQGG
ncbi:MAG: NADH-quinone oxidoreductase subunit NuoH [Anaerolineae bacterium]|nr:NADH-quinone oxidoreductase subunit NuoH [Anaerolineae bacterium]